MSRPRIEGIDDRIIKSFVDRGIYPSAKEVIHEALKALVKSQKIKEAELRGDSLVYEDSTYSAQLTPTEMESENASMGYLARKTTAR